MIIMITKKKRKERKENRGGLGRERKRCKDGRQIRERCRERVKVKRTGKAGEKGAPLVLQVSSERPAEKKPLEASSSAWGKEEKESGWRREDEECHRQVGRTENSGRKCEEQEDASLTGEKGGKRRKRGENMYRKQPQAVSCQTSPLLDNIRP